MGCVLLTTGDRPAELARAVGSVRAQRDVDVDVLVVVNAPGDVEVDGARTLPLGENVGIPAGRNRGLAAVDGEVVCFLDDDAWLAGPDVLGPALARFDADPRLAALSLRITDEHGHTLRRHVPRLRVGDATRSSEVTTFLGGASLLRRSAFEACGGLPDEFFYAHEETSLAWRLIDAGWRLAYAGDLVAHHPRTPVTRHAEGRRRAARNRVLLARRHLPAPLALIYPALWLALTLARDPAGWRETLQGTRQGITRRAVPRRPISWATVWRMTRLGRPPVL